jgi:hypothetical protein
MDSMTLIAIASILIAGHHDRFGMHDAGARRRARGLECAEFAGTATRRFRHDHPDLVCWTGDGRVHGHLLFRGLDDSHFRQPVLESRHRRSDKSGRKVTHAHRLVHRRCASDQLSHSGVVDEALPLQTHPARHRCAGKANRCRTRRRRRDKGRSQKGTRRVPAQERGVRLAARGAFEHGNQRGEYRASAAP